jgi:hypothetical protein
MVYSYKHSCWPSGTRCWATQLYLSNTRTSHGSTTPAPQPPEDDATGFALYLCHPRLHGLWWLLGLPRCVKLNERQTKGSPTPAPQAGNCWLQRRQGLLPTHVRLPRLVPSSSKRVHPRSHIHLRHAASTSPRMSMHSGPARLPL